MHVDLLRERAREPGHVLDPTRSRGALAGRGPDGQRRAERRSHTSDHTAVEADDLAVDPLAVLADEARRRGPCLDRTEPLQGGVKKVWEADTLRYPKSLREMRIVSLINEEDVIERILRHLGLWQRGAGAFRHRPARRNDLDPWLDDPFPDYDTEPVLIFPEN